MRGGSCSAEPGTYFFCKAVHFLHGIVLALGPQFESVAVKAGNKMPVQVINFLTC